MRPTFELPLPDGAATFFEELDLRLKTGACGYVGQIIPGHAVVHLPPDKKTILSPFLSLDWDEGAQLLHGRFSPHPNVWMGFMATYILLGIAGLAGAMYGLAELSLGHTHWSLWTGPIAVAVIAFIYGAAVIGQGLTTDDMYALRAFIERTAAGRHPCTGMELSESEPPES